MDEILPISQELLGEIHDQHYVSEKETPYSVLLTVQRIVWSDRTFYTLLLNSSYADIDMDLDEHGWRNLRALCDTVLTAIHGDAASPLVEPLVGT